ncbi:MAG: hypothetical protein A2070_11750 [Bdellovibrionales bacterium GWC1_52_8]|nr:MAG: hypothetical protein A2Z97_13460 [Bdellovibrionales bacterium GWB1_52_6]OFZ03176.1 MAG: hypothetical protein A2X97_04130 [Bdellovibrionales bacterium GWA1_52_35]OFZ35195.1 MAG: hypothetical protein A2070_11750 [Bdellovibrionales bacterium GWC1_52_8]
MFTDMVGYSSLTSRDEVLAFKMLEEQKSILRSVFPAHGGKENKTVGDAFFIEFESAVDAVLCAREIQTRLHERNLSVPADQRITIRIGIHLGDVINFENDSYGDGVNIASRVETHTRPGGIYVTQQVYDQVAKIIENPFELQGRVALKNISRPVAIYHLRLPWEDPGSWSGIRKLLTSLKKIKIEERGLRLGVDVAILTLLVAFLFSSVKSGLHNFSVHEGSLSPIGETWEYALLDNGKPGTWHDFDLKQRFRYSEKIQTAYVMRTFFRVEESYEAPTVVLGMLPPGVKLLLNGQIIGYTNPFQLVEGYGFDPRLLKKSGMNELLLECPVTDVPGFGSAESALGMAIGESSYIRNRTLRDQLTYFLSMSSQLGLSLMLFLAFLSIFLAQPKNRYALYAAFFAGFAALSMVYYNDGLSSQFFVSYKSVLKLLSLAGPSFILYSAALSLSGKRKEELWNSMLGISVLGFVLGALLTGDQSAAATYRWEQVFYQIVIFYAAVSLLFQLQMTAAAKGLLKFKLAIPFVFSAISLVLLLTALRKGYSLFAFEEFLRQDVRNAAQKTQLLLSLLAVVGGVITYILTSRTVRHNIVRDDLILQVGRLISESRDISRAIAQIQDLLAKFVCARRSTLYLADSCGRLTASFTVAGPEVTSQVQKVVDTKMGLLGYVWETRMPILINNIATDVRFKKHIQDRGENQSFKTGACMVIPLLVSGKRVGILTVAEPEHSETFQPEDFALMQTMAKDLALLIEIHQVNEQLNQTCVAA